MPGDALTANVDALVQQGLERYGQGDLVRALACWQQALGLDPEAQRATQYIAYVRANFELLEEQFREARIVADAALAKGIPIGERETLDDVVSVGDDDDDYYGEIIVEDADFVPIETESRWTDDQAAVDEGWGLDAFTPGGDIPRTAAEAVDRLGPALEVMVDGVVAVAGGHAGDGNVEVAADAALRGFPASAVSQQSERRPAARRAITAAEENAAAIADAVAAGGRAEHELTVPGGHEPPPLPDTPALSQDALDAIESAIGDVVRKPPAPTSMPAGDPVTPDLAVDISMQETGTGSRPSVTRGFDDDDVGTSDRTAPARPSSVGIDLQDLDLPEPGSERGVAVPSGTADPAALADGHGAAADDEEATLDRGLWSGVPDADLDEEQTRERSPQYRDAGDGIGLGTGVPDPIGLADVADGDGEAAVIIDQSLFGVEMQEEVTGRMQVDDLRATRELPAHRGLGLDSEDASDYTAAPATLERRLRAPITGVAPATFADESMTYEQLAEQLLAAADADAPPGESATDTTKRRVSGLLVRADAALEAGDARTAATAVDLAFSEAPSSAAAQKILHAHAELVIAAYELYLGDPSGRLMVTVQLQELATMNIDSRAAFLLSRIDGIITIDEVLDVAGMGRMEAYRHIGRLLLSGILAIRGS